MKIKNIPASYSNKYYKLHKYFGVLLEYKNSTPTTKVLVPKKTEKHISQVLNPYLLNSNTRNKQTYSNNTNTFFAKLIAKVFTVLCLYSFVFVRLLSLFRLPIFNSTTEAIIFYRTLYPGLQKDLCLPRSLFAACTSKTFKKEGTLFIGVFLPSRAMHAWIIENNQQPDSYDDIWICYQPLLVMHNK